MGRHPDSLRVYRMAGAVGAGAAPMDRFDTTFHATLPPEAHTYAIPPPWRQAGRGASASMASTTNPWPGAEPRTLPRRGEPQ